VTKFNNEDNYDNFRKENWDNLSPDERRVSLQNFEDECAIEQGRDSRRIDISESVNDEYGAKGGQYDHDKDPDTIKIDSSYVGTGSNPFDAMDVIAHEGRHASQHDAIEGKEIEDIDEEQVDEFKENFDEYIDPEEERLGEYEKQLIEKDATDYANKKINSKEMQQRFENDENYNNAEPVKDYQLEESFAKEQAYAEQSAKDFEDFEKGKKNQFSMGNSEKGYREYQQRVDEQLNNDGVTQKSAHDMLGGNNTKENNTIEQSNVRDMMSGKQHNETGMSPQQDNINDLLNGKQKHEIHDDSQSNGMDITNTREQ
jgi:hypothetical protein